MPRPNAGSSSFLCDKQKKVSLFRGERVGKVTSPASSAPREGGRARPRFLFLASSRGEHTPGCLWVRPGCVSHPACSQSHLYSHVRSLRRPGCPRRNSAGKGKGTLAARDAGSPHGGRARAMEIRMDCRSGRRGGVLVDSQGRASEQNRNDQPLPPGGVNRVASKRGGRPAAGCAPPCL